jgi:hypothetical protein
LARLETARLLVLSIAERGAYLALALPDAALRRAGRKLGLVFPGYRLEKIPGSELAMALAEEYETDPRAAHLIDDLLDDACRIPCRSRRGRSAPAWSG